MFKPINIIGIAVFFILGLFSLGFCEESMTITTYYPSPYGSYRELRAQFMAIGGNYSGPTYCWPPASCGSGQIDSNTNLIVEGNVGIGMMSPQAKLGIAIASPVSPALLWTIAGWNKAIEIPSGTVLKWQANSAGWRHGIGETTSGLYFVRSQGDTGSAAISYSMFIGDNGNVGIGTPSPGAQLDLSTDSARKLSSTTWATGSDIRLKKNIRPFTDGLNVISRINPVWFKWNGKAGHKDDGKDNIGVIGQEIEKVAPYTVTRTKAKLQPTDKNETELIDFTSHALIFALINSVKEMDTKITKLEKENADLRQRINALEKIKKPGRSPK